MADWKCPHCGLELNFSELCNSGGHTCLEQLREDNKQLKAENEKLSEQYDQLHIDFVATKRQLEEENKRFRNALLNIAERSKTANTPDSMSSTARRALSGGKNS